MSPPRDLSRWRYAAEVATIAMLLWVTLTLASWLVRPDADRTLLPLEDLEHAAYPYQQPVHP